jgi:hypothetical protein
VLDSGLQLGARDHPVRQTEFLGPGGVQRLGRGTDLQGPGVTHDLHQLLGPAQIGHEAQPSLRHHEHGVVTEQADVGGER